MKSLLLLVTFLSFVSVGSSQIDYQFKLDEGGLVYFDDVIEVENQNKNELFLKGKDWVFSKKRIEEEKKPTGIWVSNEKSDRGVLSIEFEDKEEGKIYGRGRTNTLIYKNAGTKMNGGSIKYKITLLFKDNRTKIIIDELIFEGGDMMGVNSGAFLNEDYPKVFGSFGKSQIRKQWALMRLQAIKEFEDIISEYRSAILKKSNKTADW